MIIGTLNEGPLHRALKTQYARRYAAANRSASEVQVGDYVADVIGDDNVRYEIQTGGFGAIRRKLEDQGPAPGCNEDLDSPTRIPCVIEPDRPCTNSGYYKKLGH